MKMTHSFSIDAFKDPRYWLSGLAASLTAIYLHCVARIGDLAHFGMSILFLWIVGMLLWEKRYSLSFEGRLLDRAIGVGLLSGLGFSNLLDYPMMLRIFPFAAAIGVGLIASGLRGLAQYRKELCILFFLGIPSVIASLLFDISRQTAAFATLLLHYAGYTAERQGVFVTLPGGSIEVYGGVTGMESMTYLLGVSVICLVMFPVSRLKQLFAPIVAMLTGFIVNGVRVSLMALLVSDGQESAFQYWNEGDGSVVFGLVSVAVFGIIYLFWVYQEEQTDQILEGLPIEQESREEAAQRQKSKR